MKHAEHVSRRGSWLARTPSSLLYLWGWKTRGAASSGGQPPDREKAEGPIGDGGAGDYHGAMTRQIERTNIAS